MKLYQLNEQGFITAHKIEQFTPKEQTAIPCLIYMWQNGISTYKDIVHNTNHKSFRMARKLKMLEQLEDKF